MTIDADVARLAGGDNLATIVTLMPDGQPQAQLRWIDVRGDHLVVNTEPQRQAARNVARDPRITVHICSKSDPYDWVEVRGEVVEMVGGEEARAHVDELARKYTGSEYRNPIGPEGRVMLVVEPRRVVTPTGRR